MPDTEDQRRIGKLEAYVFHGNGKPALVERVGVVETIAANTMSILKEQNVRMDKHDQKLDRLIWLVAIGLGIILTLEFIAPLAVDAMKGQLHAMGYYSQNPTTAVSYYSEMK